MMRTALVMAAALVTALVAAAGPAAASVTNECTALLSNTTVNQAQDCATYGLNVGDKFINDVLYWVCLIISDDPDQCVNVIPLPDRPG